MIIVIVTDCFKSIWDSEFKTFYNEWWTETSQLTMSIMMVILTRPVGLLPQCYSPPFSQLVRLRRIPRNDDCLESLFTLTAVDSYLALMGCVYIKVKLGIRKFNHGLHSKKDIEQFLFEEEPFGHNFQKLSFLICTF